MTFKSLGLFVAAISVSLLCSFGESTDPIGVDGMDTVSPIEPIAEPTSDVVVMDYILPSPLQIALIFNHAGLEFKEEVTNDPNIASNYVSKNSKLLNFGAYSADLSYCVVNDQPDEAMKYMAVVRDMSEDLGLGSVFNSEKLMGKFERNLTNQDTLIEILTELQERLDEYVDDNDERFMHACIFSGAWIESMYLGYKSAEDLSMGRKLTEQMTILDNIAIGLSKNPSNDESINKLVEDLHATRAIYENFEAIKTLEDSEEPDFSLLEISDEEVELLGQKLEQIRNSFVEL
jgi:hypothetical protein